VFYVVCRRLALRRRPPVSRPAINPPEPAAAAAINLSTEGEVQP
jgi:hypothetical protein